MEVKTASIGVGKFPMLDTIENFVQVLFDNDFPMKVPFVILQGLTSIGFLTVNLKEVMEVFLI